MNSFARTVTFPLVTLLQSGQVRRVSQALHRQGCLLFSAPETNTLKFSWGHYLNSLEFLEFWPHRKPVNVHRWYHSIWHLCSHPSKLGKTHVIMKTIQVNSAGSTLTSTLVSVRYRVNKRWLFYSSIWLRCMHFSQTSGITLGILHGNF